MTRAEVAHAYILNEVEALEPFDFLVLSPAGRLLHVTEVMRREDGGLEVRVPGRPEGIMPTLDDAQRDALVAQGFECEDPKNPAKPWTHPVADAEAAVALMQSVRVEAFGDKPDASLDVAHGSYRAEHEAEKKLAEARSRIESIVSDILGKPAERDEDGDYVLPLGEVRVMVAPRAVPDAEIVVRVFAITNVGINVTPELGIFLARLNFGLMYGRFALDVEHRSIWFDETIFGENFREEELRFAIRIVSSTADGWDDRLKQMFGGATHQEVLAGRIAGAPPPIKPGEGPGMYL